MTRIARVRPLALSLSLTHARDLRDPHRERASARALSLSHTHTLWTCVTRIVRALSLSLSFSLTHARDLRDPHRTHYARVRSELRLNEPLVISGSAGPANCNPACAAGIQ